MTKRESPWMNFKQAMEYIGRTEDALRALVKKKRIEYKKPDGRLQFHRDDLDRFMGGDDE